MSLRIIPLIIIPFILYNVAVVLMHGDPVGLRAEAFSLPLISGPLSLTWGDILILVTMGCLFVELIKSTFTTTSAMIDHGLSMLVFIACLVEFLIIKAGNSSIFFFIMIACLIDVVAGFMIGMRQGRRSVSLGTDN